MNVSDGYIAYIINPKSGASSETFASRQFQRYLTARGYRVRVSVTNSLEHACTLARAAARDSDCALVVAAGGDGTIREVAHGLEGSSRPLLIVPCGTENLLACELGLDQRVETLIRAFEGGATRLLDLGMANDRRFASIAGIGFDGAVVDLVNRRRRGHINYFAYVNPLWRIFWSHTFEPMQVEVDGQQIFSGPGMVFVGNISRYAIGLKILHDADYSDGVLDVCIYKCSGRIHLLKHSMLTVLKQHTRCRDVIYQQGKEITVTSVVDGIKTEIDGDPGPSLPMHIRVVPRAVCCVVPPGGRPAGIRRRLMWSLR